MLGSILFSIYIQSAHAEVPTETEVWNLAVTALNDGKYQECLDILSGPGRSYVEQPKFLDLGYSCAVSASNLRASDFLREQLSPFYQPRNALDIHHAWMLEKEGRKGEALDALIPEGWNSQEEKQVGTTMFAVLLVNKERWTEAAYVAASPHVEPRAKLYIAQQLRENGYPLAARELYDRVCPKLENPEEWGCASVMRIPTKLK